MIRHEVAAFIAVPTLLLVALSDPSGVSWTGQLLSPLRVSLLAACAAGRGTIYAPMRRVHGRLNIQFTSTPH